MLEGLHTIENENWALTTFSSKLTLSQGYFASEPILFQFNCHLLKICIGCPTLVDPLHEHSSIAIVGSMMVHNKSQSAIFVMAPVRSLYLVHSTTLDLLIILYCAAVFCSIKLEIGWG